MGRPLDTNDYIAIVELVLYVFFLIGSIILCIKHGFLKSSGWRFLVILSLARIIGSGMLLGSIASPTNENLYIGWQTLNGIGLGPLILSLLGGTGRIFDSVNRQGQVVVKPLFQRLIEILMLVGLILIIIGGTQSTWSFADGHIKVEYATLSKVGIALMIVVMVLVVAQIVLAFRYRGFIAQGENRILLAVTICTPFVIVRLIYACVLILGGVANSVWLSLALGVIMEIIVVFTMEVLGFSLSKASALPKDEREHNQDYEMQNRGHP